MTNNDVVFVDDNDGVLGFVDNITHELLGISNHISSNSELCNGEQKSLKEEIDRSIQRHFSRKLKKKISNISRAYRKEIIRLGSKLGHVSPPADPLIMIKPDEVFFKDIKELLKTRDLNAIANSKSRMDAIKICKKVLPVGKERPKSNWNPGNQAASDELVDILNKNNAEKEVIIAKSGSVKKTVKKKKAAKKKVKKTKAIKPIRK
jgi:hypothetical protein